jgi:hypothetical protein
MKIDGYVDVVPARIVDRARAGCRLRINDARDLAIELSRQLTDQLSHLSVTDQQ